MNKKLDVLIMGGGVAGLSAGYILSKEKVESLVCEKDLAVGGLAKTIVKEGFRFDLGGHRFFTKKEEIKTFVEDLMGDELVVVPRVSKIYLKKKFFDYPLKPANALLGIGIFTTMKILLDHGFESLKNFVRRPKIVSFEDWIASKFGRTMFNLYFKTYSEKAWGIECDRISAEWAAQRIKGLSLKVALKNAFFKSKKGEATTLIDEFLYPSLGIGRISERLHEEINKENKVFLNVEVIKIHHKDSKINSAEIKTQGKVMIIEADHFVSSIPLTELVGIMHPKPSKAILDAAKKLGYRDLVIVTLMLDRERVMDNTWMYIPEHEIVFGRLHEPKNWSIKMSPQGKTSLVLEYFCFEGDRVWNMGDEEIVELSINDLQKLGFVRKSDVLDSVVLRIKKAYPMYELGYEEYYNKILEYIQNFKNLQIIGRGGTYKYLNTDYAIESGIKAAENIIKLKK